MSSPTRTPWPPGFPDVVIHTDVKRRDAHPAYPDAKSGNAEAALLLANDLLAEMGIDALRDLVRGQSALILPVIADETLGFNAIPDVMAQVIGRLLELPVVSADIVQTNKVGHTRAPAFQRLVTPAVFDGLIQAGRRYLVIDDHVGLGGTLANLRGFLEAGGASVIGFTTLTESRNARQISLKAETRQMLWERHGTELESLWQGQFGHGIDSLTEVEALQLCRQPSVVAIQDFLAKAAVEARGRGLDPVA